MSVKKLYNKQMELNKAFEESINKIRNTADKYTAAEINKKVEEKQKEFNLEAETIGAEIINALNNFRKEKKYNSVAIDNPVFTSLLQAIQVFGESVPRQLLDTAVFKLKNEQGTLMAIKTLLKKHNIHYENIDKLIIDNILIDSAIREANKYGKSKPIELGKVMQIANAIEDLENYNLPEYQTLIENNKLFF